MMQPSYPKSLPQISKKENHVDEPSESWQRSVGSQPQWGYNPRFCLAIHKFMGPPTDGWPPIGTGLPTCAPGRQRAKPNSQNVKQEEQENRDHPWEGKDQ